MPIGIRDHHNTHTSDRKDIIVRVILFDLVLLWRVRLRLRDLAAQYIDACHMVDEFGFHPSTLFCYCDCQIDSERIERSRTIELQPKIELVIHFHGLPDSVEGFLRR